MQTPVTQPSLRLGWQREGMAALDAKQGIGEIGFLKSGLDLKPDPD